MTLASLVPNAKQSFFDNNGDPLGGGFVYMYIPNTTTFKNTWQDEEQTITNTNPIVLDAGGRAVIYGIGKYRQVVRDIDGNLIWDQLTRVGIADADTTAVMIFSVFTPEDAHSCVATFDRGLILAVDAAGSYGFARDAATAEVVINVYKYVLGNPTGTLIGTVTFAAAGNFPTYDFAAEVEFEPGDSMEMLFPATADATLAALSVDFHLEKV
jgi:hypothetical protein